MRKSLFSEIFYLSVMFLTASVICIGAVLLVVSGEYYKSDRRQFLDKIVSKAVRETISASAGTGETDRELLESIYSDLSAASEVDLTLTDSDGVALVCSEASPCSHTVKSFGSTILNRVTENGFYELSSLDNYYMDDYFNSAYKFELNGETFYLFGRLSSQSLTDYIYRLVVILLAVTAAMMSLVFVIMYMSTKRMLTPVREMSMAAKRFGKGDFSKKLRVTSDNELGFLASLLNKMAGSLEQIEETRKSFISNVSHELKTPMTTIGGFIDGILDGTIPPERQEHYLRIVSSEVDRLARLVRSMLNISKYEAGELSLSKENFDVIRVIASTLPNFEKRIEEKNIEIRGLDREPFIITADEDLMKQVVYNLTENAVKFVNKGGYIEFFFSENEDMSAVTIRNSGEGLKKDEISKVFERFYKTDESRGIDPTGVGLGLSIVSSLIKLHDGNILVRSEPDRYVEFEFSLKKQRAEQGEKVTAAN